MYIEDLVKIFETKLNSEFQNLKICMILDYNEKILFEGTVQGFIKHVHSSNLDAAFLVCEIRRENSLEYEDDPIYNKPMIITVV